MRSSISQEHTVLDTVADPEGGVCAVGAAVPAFGFDFVLFLNNFLPNVRIFASPPPPSDSILPFPSNFLLEVRIFVSFTPSVKIFWIRPCLDML